MIPVNRIKRWPFPGVPLNDAIGKDPLGKAEGLRGPDGELPSVHGALTKALGEREGARVFSLLRDLATEQAKTTGGIPCICFKDEMGEFASFEEDGVEEVVEDDAEDESQLDAGEGPDEEEGSQG